MKIEGRNLIFYIGVSMSKAKKGDGVRVHYTGTFSDGTVFDSSYERNDPLAFNLGAGMVIPGFDQAVEGMKVGDKKSVEIKSENAYGPYFDELVQQVKRSDLPPGLNPEVGTRLQAEQPDGQRILVTVTAADDESITLDANHPLAEKDLNFELELMETGDPFEFNHGGCAGCESKEEDCDCDDPDHIHEGCKNGDGSCVN